MVAAAEACGVANMVGFNYIRTPASRFARQLIAEGAIGDVTWFRGEHTEDFSPTRHARQLAHRPGGPTAPWAIWPRT
jgi:predicted dehydrogenase